MKNEFQFLATCQKDAAKMLYDNGIAGLAITFFAACLLVLSFDNPQVNSFKYGWLAAMGAMLFIRLLDVLWWKKNHLNTDFNGQKSIQRFAIGAIATAFMWCVYSLYIFRHQEVIELACTIMIVSALAGGASTVLAANKTAATLYPVILLLPFSLALLFAGEEYQQILGVLGIGFTLVMYSIAAKSAEFTSQAIKLKNENMLLVHNMEEQVAQRTMEIHHLSNIDPLTGLSNRTAFLFKLQQQMDFCDYHQQNLAVLFIDLDGFKKINDSLGHEVGDQILKETAERLNQLQEKHLLCRWGGDEFLIAISNQTEHEIVQFGKQVIASINQSYMLGNNRLSLGATIGVAYFPEHSKDKLKLIELADTAMYFQKKLASCNVKVFSQELGNQLQREQKLKDRLAQAIENNELRLTYQPIQQSSDHKITSFEALIRWQLDGETIPPEELIMIAEQYGMIRKVGHWVLSNACQAAKLWNTNGRNISVSVNVSVIQFQDADFIDLVKKSLAQSQLSANLLHLEITETVFIVNPTMLFERIKVLQSLGIQVSIDDFGTGFSSLSVMQDLGVNIIKIDKVFVDKITTSGLAIIEAVMQIATTLGYKVVAEGVETKEQAMLLKKMGVHFLQGFYFDKPIELAELSDYLANADNNSFNNLDDFSLTSTDDNK